MTGPYIVTTKRRVCDPWPWESVVSRLAVATLEGLDPYLRDEFEAGRSVTVEPNDGTVIEVEQTSWARLANAAAMGAAGPYPGQEQRVLDAYNAQQKAAA